jgi:hypothetical protein
MREDEYEEYRAERKKRKKSRAIPEHNREILGGIPAKNERGNLRETVRGRGGN